MSSPPNNHRGARERGWAIIAAALEAWDAGLAVHPAKEDGSKMPVAVPVVDDEGQPVLKDDGSQEYGWKHLQTKRETREGIKAYFASKRTGHGIFTGAVSGGTILFDFDCRRTYDQYKALAEALGLGDVVRRIEAGYCEDTPNDGVHWLVKVERIGGNTKLARRPKLPEEMQDPNDKTKTLIETRENGGWGVLAPSNGRVHETGRPYVLRSGSFATIATLTLEEQEQLWALARTFDTMPEAEGFKTSRTVGQQPRAPGAPERPGDRFERVADWFDILPAGWEPVGRNGDNLLLRRPGKTRGTSATISRGGDGVLYMFTSSAAPFEPEHCYSKFGAYTLLEHGGDFKAATRLLGQRYGMNAPRTGPILDGEYFSPPGRERRNGHADEAATGRRPRRQAPPESLQAILESLALRADLPEIDAGVMDLRIVTRQAWDAIEEANARQPFIFKHGGVPVWISRDDEGRATFSELTKTHIRHILARVAEFYVMKVKRVIQPDGTELQTKVRYVVLPPEHVCADVLATPDPELPVVARMTEAPVFAPDGTLQTTPGYHAASRTYLAIPPALVIPPVSDAPSGEEITRARSLILDDLTGDFPFAGQPEKANAIGLGLEPFARAMIDGPLPLHSFEAPTPGSGKGLLADALLRPSCGRTVGAISQAKDDDEWRKRITSALVQGYPAIQIDNANRPIESGSLSMALTIPIWTDRILGLTRMTSAPVRCSWVVTANNPTYSTEMARRTVRTRIDPKVDRPQDREGWRHPELLAWVDDNRGDLIWAFCTLVRAWVAADKPRFGGRALGSFERWSHVIGGILETTGISGFLANQASFYDVADAETAIWRAFVAAWWDRFQDQEVGTKDLFPLAVQTDGLDLGNGQERSQQVKFGKLLGQQRDRVIADFRVVPTRTLQRAQMWRLLPTNPVNIVNDSEGFDPRPNTHTHARDTDSSEETFTNPHNIHRDDYTVCEDCGMNGVNAPGMACDDCVGVAR